MLSTHLRGCALLQLLKNLQKHGLRSDVKMTGQSMTTDFPSIFEGKTMMQIVGSDMSQAARIISQKKQESAPTMWMWSNSMIVSPVTRSSLTKPPTHSRRRFGTIRFRWRQHLWRQGGVQSLRRAFVQRPSLGATGLGQCAELVWQLRGEAGPRQVKEPVGLLT